MNQKKKIENYQQIAMGTGLRYDETNDLFHGERDGFDFIVYAPDARYPYMMVLLTDSMMLNGRSAEQLNSSIIVTTGNYYAINAKVSEKQQEDRKFWSEESGYQSITEGTVQCGKM